MPEALRLALTTLTVLPVRGARSLDRPTTGWAMELAPLVGLVLWLMVGPLVYLVRLSGGGNFLAASVGIATLAVLTRGLHLDGLADLADGLGSYRDPEGTRAVMKSPEVGPLGVTTLMLSLLLQVTGFVQCLDKHVGTASLLLAMMTGRLAVTAACRATPAATPDGLGAMVAETARRWVVIAWAIGIGAVLASYTVIDPDAVDTAAVRAPSVIGALGIGLLMAHLLLRHAVRRVGGLTGDVLGALVEVTTTTCLVVLAIAI